MRFRDRADAGERLGEALTGYRDARPLVVGLARGGVLVAAEVARALGAPLYVTVVRKLGHPRQPELGLGAVAEDGVPVWNSEALERFQLDEDVRERIVRSETAEVRRRLRRYERGLLPDSLAGRTVVLVDDGLATGGSARAALAFLRRKQPERLVLAVPVGTPDVVDALRAYADEVVALTTPTNLMAVGLWYAEFGQADDGDVLAALRTAENGSST